MSNEEKPIEILQKADKFVNLERQLKMTKMRKEIIEIEKEWTDRKTDSHHRKYCFSVIKGAIAKFCGDDSSMIEKWVDDFEMVMAPLQSGDGFHLMCVRRLMLGTARIWLRTVIVPT